jgi:hypothetical protein
MRKIIKKKMIEIVNELEEIKNRRHKLRCEMIEFIKNNYDSYPNNVSTGHLGHQIDRKNKLGYTIDRNHIGDICDKELIKDAKNILVGIEENPK